MRNIITIMGMAFLALMINTNQAFAAQLDLSVSSTGISANGSGKVRMLVSQPNDEVVEINQDGSATWASAGAEDGVYRYDVIVTDEDGSTDRESGRFIIDGGSIQQDTGTGGDTSSLDRDFTDIASAFVYQSLETIATALTSPVLAQDLTIEDVTPAIDFIDNTTGEGNDWQIEVFEGSTDTFTIRDLTEDQDVIEIRSRDDTTSTVTTDNSMVIDVNGDISLADESLFVDRSSGRLGLEQTAPAQTIHATEVSPFANQFIRLENTAESTWDIGQDSLGDMVINIASNGNPDGPTGNMMRISDNDGRASFPNGLVGLTSSAEIRVEESSGPAGSVQTLFNLINNGPPAFRFFDSNSGQTWQFRGAQSGSFFIDDPATAGTEVEVRPGGEMRLSGAIVQTSSRAKKANFTDVDANDILNKVINLDISAWNYIADPKAARHIGPVAEDFYAAFELGSEPTGISPVDTAGVTFASIQALHSKVVELNARIEELETANKRIADLEATLAHLVSKEELATTASVSK